MTEILKHVPAHALPELPFAEARIRMAEAKLRLDLSVEVMAQGRLPTEEELDRMIASIPKETLYRLIAERT